jgi:hypothetical protein
MHFNCLLVGTPAVEFIGHWLCAGVCELRDGFRLFFLCFPVVECFIADATRIRWVITCLFLQELAHKTRDCLGQGLTLGHSCRLQGLRLLLVFECLGKVQLDTQETGKWETFFDYWDHSQVFQIPFQTPTLLINWIRLLSVRKERLVLASDKTFLLELEWTIGELDAREKFNQVLV